MSGQETNGMDTNTSIITATVDSQLSPNTYTISRGDSNITNSQVNTQRSYVGGIEPVSSTGITQQTITSPLRQGLEEAKCVRPSAMSPRHRPSDYSPVKREEERLRSAHTNQPNIDNINRANEHSPVSTLTSSLYSHIQEQGRLLGGSCSGGYTTLGDIHPGARVLAGSLEARLDVHDQPTNTNGLPVIDSNSKSNRNNSLYNGGESKSMTGLANILQEAIMNKNEMVSSSQPALQYLRKREEDQHEADLREIRQVYFEKSASTL